MRTISVRLSLAEHRLLNDLAGARGVSIETLVREAMALAPFETADGSGRRLQIVRSESPQGESQTRGDPSGAGR
jgi:hypothetical protein